jgi:hypothetical protein
MITVRGIVVDADTNKPINDIIVRVKQGAAVLDKYVTKHDNATNQDGFYSVTVPASDRILKVVFDQDPPVKYVHQQVSALAGHKDLVINKAMPTFGSALVSACDVSESASDLRERLGAAWASGENVEKISTRFGRSVAVLYEQARKYPDDALQGELDALVQSFHREPSLMFSPDGRTLLTTDRRTRLRSWRVVDEETVREMWTSGPSETPLGYVFMQDSKIAVSKAASPVVDLLELTDFPPKKASAVVRPQAGPQRALASTTDGKMFASAGAKGVISLYQQEGNSLSPLRTLYAGPGAVRALAFSSDVKYLASATLLGDLRVWHVPTGEEVLRLNVGRNLVNSIALSADGHFLAVGTGLTNLGMTLLFDAQTQKKLFELREDGGAVTSVHFSPDGRFLLASPNLHPAVSVWNTNTGTKTKTERGLRGGAVSPDRRAIGLVGEDDKPIIRDLRKFLER